MRFDKKLAIITGAGAGMGRATALAFAKEDAYVFITDKDEERLNSTAKEIQSAGGSVKAIKGDATESSTVNTVVGEALGKYGKIDILFNYVGGNPNWVPPQPFIEDTEALWDAIIKLNLMTTIRFTRAMLDSMINQKYGKIISIGSVAGKVGMDTAAVYSAAKGGVIAFTKALAREVAQFNINVNCISPGPIPTLGFSIMLKDQQDRIESFRQAVPSKRMGRPEEVANAVLFLASDEASYINGQALSIDGGQTGI